MSPDRKREAIEAFIEMNLDAYSWVWKFATDCKIKKREEEECRDSEHQGRRAMDDLRSFLKHLEPSVSVSDTWEAIRP
jgi:hypothetical protein